MGAAAPRHGASAAGRGGGRPAVFGGGGANRSAIARILSA